MNTQTSNASSNRGPIALAIVAGLILAGVAGYLFIGGPAPLAPINGPKIVAAVNAYSRALVQNHAPIPAALPLQTLVDKGFLRTSDMGALQGMDAKVFLTANAGGAAVLMQVHMPDGTDFVLLDDGTVRQARPAGK